MMKKIEYLGLFVCILLLSGIGMTLYPRRVAFTTEDTIAATALNYANTQFLKIKMNLEDAIDPKLKKSALAKASKALKKIHKVAQYIQSVINEAITTQKQIAGVATDAQKKSGQSMIKKAQDYLKEIKNIENYAQNLIDQANMKPDAVTKKEKETALLENIV
jgi:hypothetical protein